MAAAVSEFFGVTVLVEERLASSKISGRLVSRTLKEALDGFSFLLGVQYRSDESGRFYEIGGAENKVLTVFPSYGLAQSQVAGFLHDGGVVVGDKILTETEQTRSVQIRDALAQFAERPTLNLQIVVLDVADDEVTNVNDWLQSFNVAAEYVHDVANPYSAAAGAVSSVITNALSSGSSSGYTRAQGFHVSADAQGVLTLVNAGGKSSVELRQQVEVLSGGTVTFSSGQVVQNTLYTRESQTSNDLASQIERRTVGLQLTLEAVHVMDNWHLSLQLTDSTLDAAGNEYDTTLNTEKMLAMPDAYTLLASFTRKAFTGSRQKVPLLSAVPGLGKLFRTASNDRQLRNVMILVRPVFPAQYEPKYLPTVDSLNMMRFDAPRLQN